MSDWSGFRVAVVTGGASGIGLAIAERLAADGAAVAILDLDGDAARAAAAEIDGALGLACDVTDRPRVEAAVAEVADRLEPPLILVNNAGMPGFVPFLEMSVEFWHRRLDLNLTGTFHCCQVVLPHMVAAGWGRIVNVSSSSALSGTPRMAAYVAAKSGVIGLTKSLATEFGPRGITVNNIPPSSIDTPMLRAAESAGDLNVDAAIGMTPVRRLGRPDDIAATVSFLCREEAGYITAQTIPVTGGRTT